MSLDDLESKLLSDPEPKGRKVVKKERPAPKKKEEPAPPAPVPTPAPEKRGRPAKKEKYVELPPAPAPVKPAPVKVEKPKPERKPREEKKKVESKPQPAKAVVTAPAEKDPNASTVGVALGAAPLIVAPFVALAGARGALSKTQARRAQIQKEIEEKEAARKKLERTAEVDGGGVAGALVSFISCLYEYYAVCMIAFLFELCTCVVLRDISI